MLARVIPRVQHCRHLLFRQFRRNIGISAVLCQKTATKLDPIQQLFVEKIREYNNKSKTSGGLVDATDEDKKSLQEDLDKIARQYGADGADFTKFPTFSFSDPQLDPVGVDVEAKEEQEVESEETKEDEEDKPYWEP
ncbi:hypothetical protein LSH36_4g03014 [Paralvinella palmiformis]|uniref:ATP synthase-coupling factor 6, mitochondrial n=1 Tax=Paralvinella palmiformis TaxID=53620 RepID=A0AAD9NHC4_9ANNE|nr:hypothetical protein LSH36_4g03014 [Paralvinella palmiformis]